MPFEDFKISFVLFCLIYIQLFSPSIYSRSSNYRQIYEMNSNIYVSQCHTINNSFFWVSECLYVMSKHLKFWTPANNSVSRFYIILVFCSTQRDCTWWISLSFMIINNSFGLSFYFRYLEVILTFFDIYELSLKRC